ncbi:glycerol-3-phosphate 1-O-acyltransferase PlsY [Pelagerythrobacter marinus]|uniref:glycerol-3-phosphate 1-O-acyltransferase PlsY n=1 Tax=Pelagerythrobacter marinus TaxID=538382 RepID=UPI0020368EE7|nr:glycerol-3-phosphate 1-O-acyltransferase PlsY [Pelagerythrobacter marinus]USA40708.1 glycerol-3-phosphate 1-O-acyltransferase PlsY [Pelagerythrobacter marinus]WPZ08120.1 glycerol-3-phosphate 1-O-acyltransferase PlsY [Pelagerythrobacter marinus]
METGLTTAIVLAAALGYACGSIPFGLLLTRIAGMGDVRKIGSGNIGATNVLRTGNKGLAAATLLLDLAKGFVPVMLAGRLFAMPGAMPEAAIGPVPVAALFAVLGHCFPVWLGFRGGKGVATNAGVSFGLAWPIGLAYALVWLGILGLTRISSLAGMSAVCAAAIVAAVMGYLPFVPALALIAVLVLWLHRANIRRLAAGTEPKVGTGK